VSLIELQRCITNIYQALPGPQAPYIVDQESLSGDLKRTDDLFQELFTKLKPMVDAEVEQLKLMNLPEGEFPVGMYEFDYGNENQ